jgi:hypothetical protein
MRKSYNNEILTRKKNSILMGINFGADFCAEHEWGIKGLYRIFGIPDTGYGLSKRKITKVPKELEWFKVEGVEGFWISNEWVKISDKVRGVKDLYTE